MSKTVHHSSIFCFATSQVVFDAQYSTYNWWFLSTQIPLEPLTTDAKKSDGFLAQEITE